MIWSPSLTTNWFDKTTQSILASEDNPPEMHLFQWSSILGIAFLQWWILSEKHGRQHHKGGQWNNDLIEHVDFLIDYTIHLNHPRQTIKKPLIIKKTEDSNRRGLIIIARCKSAWLPWDIPSTLKPSKKWNSREIPIKVGKDGWILHKI